MTERPTEPVAVDTRSRTGSRTALRGEARAVSTILAGPECAISAAATIRSRARPRS